MITNKVDQYGTVELTLSAPALDALSRLLWRAASEMPQQYRLELENLRSYCDTELLRLRGLAASYPLAQLVREQDLTANHDLL